MQSNPFEPAADATSLIITQHFVSLAKSCGVFSKEHVVGFGSCRAISTNDTYLQYERKMANAVTISPSLAERMRKQIEKSVFATVWTD